MMHRRKLWHHFAAQRKARNLVEETQKLPEERPKRAEERGKLEAVWWPFLLSWFDYRCRHLTM
jgi:hypothetical protein